MKITFDDILWYLKQLLPLRYETVYHKCDEGGANPRPFYCGWWMWFGRCFWKEEHELKPGDVMV